LQARGGMQTTPIAHPQRMGHGGTLKYISPCLLRVLAIIPWTKGPMSFQCQFHLTDSGCVPCTRQINVVGRRR